MNKIDEGVNSMPLATILLVGEQMNGGKKMLKINTWKNKKKSPFWIQMDEYILVTGAPV